MPVLRGENQWMLAHHLQVKYFFARKRVFVVSFKPFVVEKSSVQLHLLKLMFIKLAGVAMSSATDVACSVGWSLWFWVHHVA